MKKSASVVIVLLLVLLVYHPVHAKEQKETAQIVSDIYSNDGIYTIKNEVSIAKANKVIRCLSDLTKAMADNDNKTIQSILSKLEEEDILHKAVIAELLGKMTYDTSILFNNNNSNRTIKNIFCMVWGSGDALFAYPLDLAAIFGILLLFGWLPMGIILVLAYSVLWMYISHLIPARFFLPITLIGFNTGGITTAGLYGIQSIMREGNESTVGILIGFTGVVINIVFLPKDDRPTVVPFFCFGSAIAALEEID